jgi:hypothetical protein
MSKRGKVFFGISRNEAESDLALWRVGDDVLRRTIGVILAAFVTLSSKVQLPRWISAIESPPLRLPESCNMSAPS